MVSELASLRKKTSKSGSRVDWEKRQGSKKSTGPGRLKAKKKLISKDQPSIESVKGETRENKSSPENSWSRRKALHQERQRTENKED